ncbi:cohesin loading factor [Bisporella sp. PMI_857]|nr:cohesin loading factor [Bisporella sp. PMI_857]
MAYPGGPPIPVPGQNGYWNGSAHPNQPSNIHQYAMQSAPASSHSNPHTPYQPQYNGNHIPYERNASMDPSGTVYTAPREYQAQPQFQSQPPQAPPQSHQFINPAQLFQQPAQRSSSLMSHSSVHTVADPRVHGSGAPASSASPNVDRPKLMISLAEEFFDAAHRIAPYISNSMSPGGLEEYQKLVATGLGLLETALKNVRLPPRLEANIRLRYAGILFEETENYMEAETALSKGIVLCERNHYFDLKYAMQFLLAKIMFTKTPKAALKALDANIADAEAYHHFSWVYALRFLRASKSLALGLPTERWKENFESIRAVAQQQSDHGIWTAACLMEALAHLRSNNQDSIENAQGAIAAARSYQTEVGNQIPQLLSLAHIVDVACGLRQGNAVVMNSKLEAMQRMMDGILRDEESWGMLTDNIAIPINRTPKSSQVVSSDTRTVLGIGHDGRDNLMLSFLSKKDAYSLIYLLGGMIKVHTYSQEEKTMKAMKYFESGLSSLEASASKNANISGLLPDCISQVQWREQIICYYCTYMAFCTAAVSDWAKVRKFMEKLNTAINGLHKSLVGPLGTISMYISGIYHQGTGDLDSALQIFGDDRFDLAADKSTSSNVTQVEKDFALLAALNNIWILQESNRVDTSRNTALIEKVATLCQNHPNKDIQTAYNLMAATVKTSPPTASIQIKSHLNSALKGAQTTANMQFTAITLSVMCSRFFVSVVGEQAEKSAMAAWVQTKKAGNPLWTSVAGGLLARCLELNGKPAEASETLRAAQYFAQKSLPQM